MGGILGWIGLGAAPSLQFDSLQRRGPDDCGAKMLRSRNGRVVAVLGSTRPATCDASSADHRLASHPTEPIAVVCEGWVYNLPDLRAATGRAGAEFCRGTEAEVILQGYGLWGDAVVEKLQGAFTLAVWDGRKDGRLLLARDPFGQKPLYFREEAGRSLRFSSVLRAMLNAEGRREIDTESLAHYLDRGCAPLGQSLLRGYRKVRAGWLLLWEGGRLRERRYWDPVTARVPVKGLSRREAAEQFRKRLDDAVWPRLVSDEPVGLFLSGNGLGSAALLASASRFAPDGVRTFAACFGAVGVDEGERMRQMALSIGSTHRAILINPRGGRLLPFLASRMDEPVADASALVTYLICRRAHEEVRALLSDDGAPELLRGDSRHTPWNPRKRDIRTWLISGVLARVNSMAGAASIGMHTPFLDPLLVEWLLGSPRRLRASCLRGAVREFRAALDRGRPAKSPASPTDDWFRCEWRTLAQDVLLDRGAKQREWWDASRVSRILAEHLSGERSHGARLYQLVILELWARSILDRGGTEAIPTNVDDCARELPTDRPVRKVAVLAPAGIGDTMRLTPSLRDLAASDPCVSVTVYVAANRGSDEVMAGIPPADRHVPIDFEHKGVRRLVELVRDIRRASPDQVVSTWISTLAGLAGFLTGVRRRGGWVPQWSWAMRLGGLFWRHRVPYDPPRKDVGRYDVSAFARLLGTEPLRSTAMTFAPPIWRERALRDALDRMTEMPRPIFAVSAVAREHVRQRQYPIERMASVLTELLRHGTVRSVVLLGDEASKRALRPLAEAVNGHALNLSGALTLSATAAIMKECDAALVVDGALLHVALASDLPTVAVYGPTEIFSPDPGDGNGRYRVISAFDRCRCMCLPHRGIRVRAECCEQAQCLRTIPPSRVVDAVAEVLGAVALPAESLRV